MSWTHDCLHTKHPSGRTYVHDKPQGRSLGDWIATCPHCGKPKPMTYPERISTLTADLARLTAELERSKREREGLREDMRRAIGAIGDRQDERAVVIMSAALAAGGKHE